MKFTVEPQGTEEAQGLETVGGLGVSLSRAQWIPAQETAFAVGELSYTPIPCGLWN